MTTKLVRVGDIGASYTLEDAFLESLEHSDSLRLVHGVPDVPFPQTLHYDSAPQRTDEGANVVWCLTLVSAVVSLVGIVAVVARLVR